MGPSRMSRLGSRIASQMSWVVPSRFMRRFPDMHRELYNLYYHLPVVPSPRLNNRKFNMALGHVLGGGTSINAMVWMRGMERDYDGWAKNGASGWAFADVLPVFKSQEDWEGGAN